MCLQIGLFRACVRAGIPKPDAYLIALHDAGLRPKLNCCRDTNRQWTRPDGRQLKSFQAAIDWGSTLFPKLAGPVVAAGLHVQGAPRDFREPAPATLVHLQRFGWNVKGWRRGVAVGKKAAVVKKAAAVKKATPVKKAVLVKKTAPVKKAAPARKRRL